MRNFIALICIVLLAGCAGTGGKSTKESQQVVAKSQAQKPAKPKKVIAPKLNLLLAADKGVNPNALGQSSPVVVRVYQLKNLRQFDAIGFIDLYEDDGVLLQGSLVNLRELDPLAPGKSAKVQIPLYKSTRYIAVMAAFSDYESGEPLDVLKINSKKHHNFKVRLKGNKVKLLKLR